MARTIRTSKGEHFKGGSPDLAPVDTEDVLLRGSPAIQNRVVCLYPHDIVCALKAALAADRAESPLDASDKPVAAGRKRAASTSAPETHAVKKRATGVAESLCVLKLDLVFDPAPAVEVAIAEVLEKVLVDNRPSGRISLGETVLQQNREAADLPHQLYIRCAETKAPLVELDPLDPACPTASTWVQWIAPPPLTKSGTPLRRPSKATPAQRREPQAVAALGSGGLVDALALLAKHPSNGVSVAHHLSLELSEHDATSSASSGASMQFCLHFDVAIDPDVFFSAPYTRARRLLIDHLLPSTEPMLTGDARPMHANVDFFYACLHRAPRTIAGLPVSTTLPRTEYPPARTETEDERETRLRRAAKGKQRAVESEDVRRSGDRASSSGEEGEPIEEAEDEMIYPPGLSVSLMPFQARSVRWMLAREGKRIKPRAATKVGGDGAPGGDGASDGDVSMDNGEATDCPPDVGGQAPVLEDLDEESLKRLRRGPLWEQVKLPILSERTGSVVEVRVLWLNRPSSTFSAVDPVDLADASSNGVAGEKDDVDDKDAVEAAGGDGSDSAQGAGSRDGADAVPQKVVGGREGHGLLAEEVGLGKTVETLALVLLHRDDDRHDLPSYWHPNTNAQVQPCGATLIIAPTSIIGQWQSELARLAPGLRVLRYDGVRYIPEGEDKKELAKRFDIFLTTFDVLRKEVAIARAPTQRPLRNKREIRYRRSLLVELDFLRVLMDEAQMVGDAYGPTSETASLIPRRFSWAVTSTPLRDNISDVKPLLTFLRVEPIASQPNQGRRLIEETASFQRLISEIGTRTLKAQVGHELFLPKQIRYLVPIEFTSVERFYYDQRCTDLLASLGLDGDGHPRERTGAGDWTWEPVPGDLVRAVTTLRQLCTHPQLGVANREVLGRALKTVDECYAAMRQKADRELCLEQRLMLQARIRRAQYQMWDKDDTEERFERALALLKSAVVEIEPTIEELAASIHALWPGRAKDARHDSPPPPSDQGVAGALELIYRAESAAESQGAGDNDRDASLWTSTLARLRESLYIKHSSLFFSGHACYNLKRPEEEAHYYKAAERLRQTILQPHEDAVEGAQAALRRQLDQRDAEQKLRVDDLKFAVTAELGQNLKKLSGTAALTTELMSGYAELLCAYRVQLVDMLFTAVSIAGDDATGEEYEEKAALQERLTIYLEAYTILVGEWTHGIDGARSALSDQYKAEAAAYLYKQEVLPGIGPSDYARPQSDTTIEDVRVAGGDALIAAAGPSGQRAGRRLGGTASKSRDASESTKWSARADGEKSRFQARRGANLKANSWRDFLAPTVESGHAPGDVLRYNLLVERLKAKGDNREFEEVTPLRQIIKMFREAEQESQSSEESSVLKHERKRIRASLDPLGKVADRLRAELSDFNKAFNARVRYFASLQQISDEVADPDMGSKHWRGLLLEIETLHQEEHEHKLLMETKQSRLRYLENLDSGDEQEQTETNCPICCDRFDRGVLTSCGHLTCASCFRHWRAQSKSCALCKQELVAGSWTTVTYRKRPEVPLKIDPERGSRTSYIDSCGVEHAFQTAPPSLAELDEGLRAQIMAVETAAPLSSKSDFIVKHVKFIRRRHPDAKIVIFSTWTEALTLLMEALSRNGVRYIRLEGQTGKGKKESVVKRFQEDPDIAVFLLHTQSQAAGLNLTVARYVFLVEPTFHPSFELQAVARVHRITQTKKTWVFKYAVSDTVDRRIEELRAIQGTSLFLSSSIVDAAAESRLVQQTERVATGGRLTVKNDETAADPDQTAQILLPPAAFQNLQRALLPARLRTQELVARTDAAPSPSVDFRGAGPSGLAP